MIVETLLRVQVLEAHVDKLEKDNDRLRGALRLISALNDSFDGRTFSATNAKSIARAALQSAGKGAV